MAKPVIETTYPITQPLSKFNSYMKVNEGRNKNNQVHAHQLRESTLDIFILSAMQVECS